MGRRETVIESIKKLVALGVSDSEIAENLYDVGIEKNEAMELISEAKGITVPVSPVVEEKKAVAGDANAVSVSPVVETKLESVSPDFDSTGKDLSMDEQIAEQVKVQKKTASVEQKQKFVQKKRVLEEIPDDIAEKIMKEVGEQEKDEEENFVRDSENKSEESVVQKEAKGVEEEDAGEKTESKGEFVGVEDKEKEVVGQKSEEKYLDKEEKKSDFRKKVSQKSGKEKKYSQGLVEQGSFDYTVPSQGFDKGVEITPEFEELWKKGIVVAVNAKLLEMKRLKENVDSEIKEKVDEAVRKELYQYKVLMDSQKELIISSNREALEQKQKEIVFVIDAKIAELRQVNKQLADNLSALEGAKKQQEFALQQINQALEDARKTKAQLVVEMNSELIKSKSQAQAFLDSANSHLSQMDQRINKTLELEKNIAEGMLQQAEQKIESLTIQRADELISEMEVELNRLQTASKNISPEALDQKIKILDDFKSQFLNNMQQSLSQINSAIDELNQKNVLAERALEEKTLAIDAKLEELTKFEKKFTEAMEKSAKKK